MNSNKCIYLHGFASGPGSEKALFFKERLQNAGMSVDLPDLNEPDFAQLTLSRQIEQVTSLIDSSAAGNRVVLLGSSMGGLVATLVAQKMKSVAALILFAPGFGIHKRWMERLGTQQLADWRSAGVIEVDHHATGSKAPLNYSFIEDAQRYDTDALKITMPALVFHGMQDDVVPLAESQVFAQMNPELVQLHMLDSDHGLLNVLDPMWEFTEQFLSSLAVCDQLSDTRA